VANFDHNFAAFEAFDTIKTPPRNKVRPPNVKSVQKSVTKQNALAVKADDDGFARQEGQGGPDPFDATFAIFGAPRTPPRDQAEAPSFKPNSVQRSTSKQTAKGSSVFTSTFSTAQADPFDTRFAVFESPQGPPPVQGKPKSSQKSKGVRDKAQQMSGANAAFATVSADRFGGSFAAFDIPSQPADSTLQQTTGGCVQKPSVSKKAESSGHEDNGFIGFPQLKPGAGTNALDSNDSGGFF